MKKTEKKERSIKESERINSPNFKPRKMVLQKIRNKPFTFRPTNEVKEFLKNKVSLGYKKTEIINKAIIDYKYSRDIENIMDELCIKYPFVWRRVNRRNGQFITQKIYAFKQKWKNNQN